MNIQFTALELAHLRREALDGLHTCSVCKRFGDELTRILVSTVFNISINANRCSRCGQFRGSVHMCPKEAPNG